jgi:hypothetical protein
MESAIAYLVVSVLLFLVFRAVVLWYWKVNEGLALLKSIDGRLAQLANSASTRAAPSDELIIAPGTPMAP